MIIGIGNDLCDVRRIEKTLARFGDRFLQRVFTETERSRAFRKANTVSTLAKRFAAKEAMAKALGTGFRRGVYLADIGVVNDVTGRPTVAVTGGAARRLDELTPEGHVATVNLTLTDEYPLAEAVVIISAHPHKLDSRG